jgi:XTP/dITP diphosphohydrolase
MPAETWSNTSNSMVLLIATTNSGKIREIRRYLAGYNLLSLADLNICQKAPETGKSFAGIAREKALFYSRLRPDMPVCAEDSGLEVDALGGRPGIFSARFEENNPGDVANRTKLLKLMSGQTNRSARFVACVALCHNMKILGEFSGDVEGLISTRPAGSGGFGYDPVFYYPPLKKTFAQLSPIQKNRVSHRREAYTGLKNHLEEILLNSGSGWK